MVNKIHTSQLFKLRDKSRMWIDPSILDALRLLAEGRTITDVATVLRKDRSNLARTLKKFREQDYPKLSAFLDVIKKESLLEKSSEKQRKQKYLQTKVSKAKQGYYVSGGPIRGFTVKDGAPTPNEEYERVKRVLRGLLAGKRPREVRRETGYSSSQVDDIRRDKRYTGEYDYRGETYRITKGDFQPLLTVEEWEELQRKIGRYGGDLIPGYEWYDGDRVLKPGGREMYQKIFAMRLNREPYDRIGREVGLRGHVVRRLVKDRRITGRIEVDGKLVDSGYEAAVDEETWKAGQKVKAETRVERLVKQANVFKQKIVALVPAFRWELIEKMNAGKPRIKSHVRKLLREEWLKENKDKLLQRKWEPYPEKVVVTHDKEESIRRLKILSVLQTKSMCTSMLTRLLGFRIDEHTKKMEDKGIVQKVSTRRGWKWSVRKDWAATVEAALKCHQVSVETSPHEIKWLEFTYPKKGMGNVLKVLQVLLRNDASTIEIANETAISKSTLRCPLGTLKKAEIIEKQPPTQYGKWRIKNDWRSFIKQKLTLTGAGI